MRQRIDAHHHLWHYTSEEFGWIEDEAASLRRDFLIADLLPALARAQVSGTVVVQARQTTEETAWLLKEARSHPVIQGVVGWLPLTSRDLATHLARLAAQPLLKGLRHVVQAEPDGFMDRGDFNTGLEQLQGTGLTYDILILGRQLPEAIRLVDRHPKQSFVLDHIAKPSIQTGEVEPWRTQLRALASRPNVACKLSGLVTEADPRHWTPGQLQPYFEIALEAFGPARCMAGTDWPVLTTGCEYAQWWALIEQWIATLTPAEQAAVVGETAQRIYSLAEVSPTDLQAERIAA